MGSALLQFGKKGEGEIDENRENILGGDGQGQGKVGKGAKQMSLNGCGCGNNGDGGGGSDCQMPLQCFPECIENKEVWQQ